MRTNGDFFSTNQLCLSCGSRALAIHPEERPNCEQYRAGAGDDRWTISPRPAGGYRAKFGAVQFGSGQEVRFHPLRGLSPEHEHIPDLASNPHMQELWHTTNRPKAAA